MGGYFSAVPLHLTENITVTSLYLRGAPWQPPPLYGMIGSRPAAPEAQVLLISNETPIALFLASSSISQQQLEQLHLDNFSTDWLLNQGSRLYEALTAGRHPSEPPDFLATSDGVQVGVDCLQFAVESRRLANGMFSSINRAIVEAEPNRFSHLAGLLVYVWADIDGKLSPR